MIDTAGNFQCEAKKMEGEMLKKRCVCVRACVRACACACVCGDEDEGKEHILFCVTEKVLAPLCWWRALKQLCPVPKPWEIWHKWHHHGNLKASGNLPMWFLSMCEANNVPVKASKKCVQNGTEQRFLIRDMNGRNLKIDTVNDKLLKTIIRS